MKYVAREIGRKLGCRRYKNPVVLRARDWRLKELVDIYK